MLNDNAIFREFDEFRLDLKKRTLWLDNEIVALPPKAIAILIELTNSPKDIVSKEELIDAVWGDSFIEESNLTHNIYLLRNALRHKDGREYITNIPRVGYRFNAEVQEVAEIRELTIERTVFSQTTIENVSEPTEAYAELIPTARRFTEAPARKNIRHYAALISIPMLIAAGFFIWSFYSNAPAGNASSVRSIAVLPPIYDGMGEQGRVISFGLADSLTIRLARSPTLVVRPMSSITRFLDEPAPAIHAGRELQVDGIIESTLQESGDRIRIQARLIRTSDGVQLWSGTFDEPVGNRFSLQDVLASRIYDELIGELSPGNKGTAPRNYTTVPEAYQAYRRGKLFYYDRINHPDNTQNAFREFELALSLDPNFALCMTGLADLYARLANNPQTPKDRIRNYEKARELARRALEIDPDLAEAHVSMAWIKRNYEWDWNGSDHHFKTALTIEPNNADTHRQYGFLLATLGRLDEAVYHSRTAVELHPSVQNNIRSYALILTYAGRYEEAFKQHEVAWRIDPDNKNDYRYVLMALYNMGSYKDLVERYESLPKEAKGFQSRSYLAKALHKLGRYDEAAKMLRELKAESETRSDKMVRFAATLAAVGRPHEALDNLEKGLRLRDDRMLWIKAQPEFHVLHSQPRFQTILKTMKLDNP